MSDECERFILELEGSLAKKYFRGSDGRYHPEVTEDEFVYAEKIKRFRR